ncbi:unnamed protein product [Adineta ricciae]|uniref:Uncharacterized protein n=1 Tax=Adineta ricciae TaxID=249248 RepID=A0A815M2N6_ADIRI|nr:unnamed protein product [Adineta ricciae]CAF1501111.1 unnamed protein product [Adineta ricciae]
MAEVAIGIDLGTVHSRVAIYENDQVKIIPDENGRRSTSSCVAFTDNGCIVSDAVKTLSWIEPKNTIFYVKRLIGREFNDPSIDAYKKAWPFDIVKYEDRLKIQVRFQNEIKIFSPEEISSMILRKMKENAEKYLGRKISQAVLTVPVSFTDTQRRATRDAGIIAGLNVLRVMHETSAAALAYNSYNTESDEKNILVFDLGGGALNVSIFTPNCGFIEVKSVAGDSHLGGEDFTDRIMRLCIEEFRIKNNVDVSNDKRALNRLRLACENAKRTLSTFAMASIEIDALYNDIDFSINVSRTRFEEINADLFRSTLVTVEKALYDAKVDKVQIHEIVLVGASTQIPRIQKLLSDFFNGKQLNQSVNPNEAVVCGAAIEAAILTSNESEKIQNSLVLDVAPHPLGIETANGLMEIMVRRCTTIPTKSTQQFSTTEDNQMTFDVKVFEGEHPMAKDNRFLGSFQLSDIPPAPRGEPQIEVTFDINGGGLLVVSAVDKVSGNQNQLDFNSNHANLSRDEIERMFCENIKYKIDSEIPSMNDRRLEQFTVDDVARFIIDIDPSFDGIACRFLREKIDGKALVLLTRDILVKEMGFKIGPALKILNHIQNRQ